MHVDIEQAGSTLKEELQELISEAEERIYEFIQERSLTESKRDTIEDEIAYENELTMQRDVEFKEIQGRKHVLKRHGSPKDSERVFRYTKKHKCQGSVGHSHANKYL